MIAGVRGGAGEARVTASDEAELARVEFFSDAVFAIAITLLVFDIKVPSGLPLSAIPDELSRLIPQIMSYVLSFAVVGIFWLSHHRMFRYLRRLDTTLMLLNLLFLLLVALVPFSTKLLAAYGMAEDVALLYPAILALAALAFYAVWWYATRGRRLVEPTLSDRTVLVVSIRSIGFAAIFVVSIFVALVSVHLAQATWFLAAIVATGLQLYPFAPGDDGA
jgi:uncharacterized membrane protein